MAVSLKKLLKATIKDVPLLREEACIAKTKDGIPGMSTTDHCTIVAYVSRVFIKSLPKYVTKKISKKILFIVGLLHDIGKVSPGFLKKIYGDNLKAISPELYKLPIDLFETKHAAISESFVLDFFKDIIKDESTLKTIASIVGAHHGSRGVSILDHNDYSYGGKVWADLRKQIARKMLKDLKISRVRSISGIEAEFYGGILSLSDWIASDERMFNPLSKVKDIIKETNKAVETLGWKKTSIRPGLRFKDLFKIWGVNEVKPREEQQAFIDLVQKPGFYIMEASTGSGKTEAALAAAYNLIDKGYHTGIYFALPTRVTSERIFIRAQSFLDRAFKTGMAPKLVHGQSLISEVDVGGGHLSPGGMWFTSNRRALLLPFGIGTLDQILMAVLNSKYNFIRTLALANKVIIIDEVHSYDVYTGKLTDLLINKLRDINCTVIVLSATLTYDRKKQLLGPYKNTNTTYPLITHAGMNRIYTRKAGTGQKRTVKVRKVIEDFPKIFKEIEKRVLAGQQVLYILNTVDRATAVYDYMSQLPSLNNNEIGLIHSRFPGIHRNKMEEHWMRILGKDGDRSVGRLLISTQVFEQSVDVDADFMITDICPSDFIIQRIGRLFRHYILGRKCRKAEIWIIYPDGLNNICDLKELKQVFGIHSLIYSEYVLWRTYKTWENISEVSIPDNFREILEETYRDPGPQDPAWLHESWENLQERNFVKEALAHFNTGTHFVVNEEESYDDEYASYIDSLEEDDDGSRPTRLLSVPTKQLLLVNRIFESDLSTTIEFIDGEKINIKKGFRPIEAAKAVTKRLVKVPANKIVANVPTPEWLEAVAFGRGIPVIVNKNHEVCLMNGTPTRYHYQQHHGIYKNINI